ncbi:helix-turn-helix domain-containing protein [Streptomyces qinglanensis]|uniref:helix-turn-helix domain-containing protein n=1 Tax=Streptomyces qinglanensis TaxID=943816 RepID=UPI003D716F80
MPARSELADQRVLSARHRIGRNMLAARERAGLTQERLAELADPSRDTIWRMETATRPDRIDWFIAVAHALDVDLADLVRE